MVGGQRRDTAKPNVHPDPAMFGLDLDEVRPLFAEYVDRSKRWTAEGTVHDGRSLARMGSMTSTCGGLDPEREYVFASKPDDPEMRESVNVWIWDDGPDVGLPRIGSRRSRTSGTPTTSR